MSNQDVRDRIGEILERAIRVESKLMRLANALKVNVREDGKVEVVLEPDRTYVRVSAMDVSLSTIIRACIDAGLSGIIVDIEYAGAVVGTLHTG